MTKRQTKSLHIIEIKRTEVNFRVGSKVNSPSNGRSYRKRPFQKVLSKTGRSFLMTHVHQSGRNWTKLEGLSGQSGRLWPITRGDTMIFNKNFFDQKFFKTGPRCAEGSIWLGKNKTSPLKES